MPERFAGVAEDDPDVLETLIVHPGEEVADPRRMDLDPDVVPVRPRGRRLEQGVSPPEPDLDHERRLAAEHGGGVDRRAFRRRHPRRGGRPEAEARPEAVYRPPLPRRHPARPQHPGTDAGPGVQAIAP